ncbi:hydroxymethylglutaryl-CoA lyase [Oceanobacillus sp. FSL W7-1281]|uniref:hydroxymethylglutaryl-CoA lyase n=1 Tax=Oceanobacillus sp. FSL W7-1281 TaxID=2921698 RepID=UPI0030DB6F27
MAFPKKVIIREVGPREGMQIEEAPVSTEDKIQIVDMISECNFPVIEVTSFVSPKWVPKMADAEKVAAGFKRYPGTEYQCVYLNAKGIERAQATGKFDLEGVLQITASETFSVKNTNLTIDETFAKMDERICTLNEFNIPVQTIAVMTAFGCTYEGDTNPELVIQLIERSIAKANSFGENPKHILLGDTVGWANPISTEMLVGKVQDRWPEKDIILHLHDTRGMGMANAYVGLKMGVTHYDSSVGGLGGCPFSGAKGAAGNIATEDLVHMCHELGISTGIDLEKLLKVTEKIEGILGRELPSKVSKGRSLNSYRRIASH